MKKVIGLGIVVLSFPLMAFTEYVPPTPIPDESKPVEFVPKVPVPDETAPPPKPVEVAPVPVVTPGPYLPQPKVATEADKELTTPAIKRPKTVVHKATVHKHKRSYRRFHRRRFFFF